jgi:hypothetical protein
MAWRAVIEDEHERTELLELTGQGCLVRVVVRNAQGAWTPATMTWCPGLTPAHFAGLGNAPAPAPAPAPPAAAEPAPAPAEPPPAEPAPAEPAPAEPPPEPPPATPAPAASSAPDIVEVVTTFARLQAVVAKAFRSQIRKVSGELGFLEDAPRVGSFSVPDHGDWVFRIDDTTVTLTSGKRVIELQLPKHLRDDGIDPKAVSRYLKGSKQTEVSYKGAGHGVEPETIDRLIKQLCVDGALRLFRSQPPTYILAA